MKIRSWLVLVLCFIWGVALAQSPVDMLKQTSDQMLAALKQNKASLKNNPGIIYGLVNRILLPHVDLESMSRSVIGRTYWDQATPQQKEEFKKLFTRQVVQTYSDALASYENEQVKFQPLRDTSGNRVQVHSSIVRPNGQVIAVNYRLINSGGDWKVYDFSVEGISIVQSYRAQFADDLSQGGLAGLLTKMRQKYGKQ